MSYSTWRVTAGANDGLSYVTLREADGTVTCSRNRDGSGGDDETRAVWSSLSDAAAFLVTTFIFGVQKARVAEQRWPAPSTTTITFAADLTWSDAYCTTFNYPRG